jgi:hypothetical protein
MKFRAGDEARSASDHAVVCDSDADGSEPEGGPGGAEAGNPELVDGGDVGG